MEGQPDGHRPLPARGGRRLRGRHHTGRRRGRGARRGSRGRGGGALARGGTAGRPSWPTPAGRPTESARMLVTVRLPWAGGPSARRSAGDGPTRIQQRHAVQNAAGQDARALEAAGAARPTSRPPGRPRVRGGTSPRRSPAAVTAASACRRPGQTRAAEEVRGGIPALGHGDGHGLALVDAQGVAARRGREGERDRAAGGTVAARRGAAGGEAVPVLERGAAWS